MVQARARATHVVDYLPWETRGATLNLAPLPGERFSGETWLSRPTSSRRTSACLFPTSPSMSCSGGHTVEDLAAPENLLKEMQRVGSGWRDRMSLAPDRANARHAGSPAPGCPAMAIIIGSVESEDGELVLSSKADSRLAWPRGSSRSGTWRRSGPSQPEAGHRRRIGLVRLSSATGLRRRRSAPPGPGVRPPAEYFPPRTAGPTGRCAWPGGCGPGFRDRPRRISPGGRKSPSSPGPIAGSR